MDLNANGKEERVAVECAGPERSSTTIERETERSDTKHRGIARARGRAGASKGSGSGPEGRPNP